MIYVIERIQTKSGEVHERALRRKGQRVRIIRLFPGLPLVYMYVNEGSIGIVRTSAVEAFNCDDEGNWNSQDVLTVQTRSSVYHFRKVGEE